MTTGRINQVGDQEFAGGSVDTPASFFGHTSFGEKVTRGRDRSPPRALLP